MNHLRPAPRLPQSDPAGAQGPSARLGRGWRLATLLVALVTAVLLPALAMSAAAVWQAVEGRQAAAEGRLRDTAKALALAVDRELASQTGALEAFAASPAFGTDPAEPDLPALYAHATRVARQLDATIVVIAEDGRQLLSTYVPLGAPLPPTSAGEVVARAIASNGPVMSDLIVSATGSRPVVGLMVPIPGPDGRATVVAGAPYSPLRLRRLLAGQGLPEGTFAAVMDAKGIVVARSDALHDAVVGRPVPPGNAREMAGREAGTFQGKALDGVERVFAFQSVRSAPGWILAVAEPVAAQAAAWRRPLLVLAAGGSLALLLGGGLALLAARRVLQPVRLLGAHARAVAADKDGAPPTAAALPPAPIVELEELRRGFLAAETALRRIEARLKLATEGAGVGTWELDLVSDRGHWSPETCMLLGVQRSVFTSGDWMEAIHPDDRPAVAARWSRAIEDGQPYEIEFRPAPRALGEGERWLVAHGRIEHDPGGRPVRGAGILIDVTDRKQAEAALRTSEATLAAVLDALPVGVVIADARGRILRDNAVHRELWGIAPRTTSWEQYGDWIGYWPETGARIQAHEWAMARALLQGETVRGELVECQRFGTGERRFYLNNAAPIRDPGGHVVAGVAAELDVTERRLAGAALRDSEARLRDLLATVDFGAFLTRDLDGTIRHWSAGCERLYGWSAAEAVGRSAHDLLATRAQVPLAEIEAALERDGEWAGDLRHRTRDGRELVVRAHKALRRDGADRPAVLEAVTDVTAQRAAEAALAESRDQLRLALEAGRMGLWSWDFATGRLEWDARQFELFGMDPAAGQPGGADALGRVHPEDRPGLDAAIAAAVRQGEGMFNHEFRVILPGGAVRWIGGHGHAIPGPDGRAARMVGLNFDVTAHREAQAMLAREAEQLEQLAERRGRALAESESRLAEAARMEALGRLAGGIAHDFNNVLQAVQGRLMLASKRVESDPGGARHHIARAVEATERGSAVTGRLLAFARRGELSAESIAPAPLLAGLAEMLAHTLGAGIEVRVATDPDLPPFFADRGQLEAVLVNLANNARDAMPRGGPLELRAEAHPHDAPGAPPGLVPGRFVRLCVVDGGEGIRPDVLARVTEPFFTTKPKGKGTGLGLAMARGFAEQSGGALAIESTPGVGTTVSLWLPHGTEAAPAARADAPEGVVAPTVPAPVLLAEDQPDVREVLVLELRDRGFTVAEAEHTAAAVTLFEGGLRPAAVVTDLSMPGELDGIGLIEEARRRWPRLPAVLVTGHAGETDPDRLAAVERGGPFALVRKPAAVEVLVDRLARVLGQGRSGVVAGG